MMSLRFTLMKALRYSICLHWYHFQKCMKHCQHMFLPSHEDSEMDDFVPRRRKSFFNPFVKKLNGIALS